MVQVILALRIAGATQATLLEKNMPWPAPPPVGAEMAILATSQYPTVEKSYWCLDQERHYVQLSLEELDQVDYADTIAVLMREGWRIK